MREYQKRNIRFKEIIEINDWKIKVYTISEEDKFYSPTAYKNTVNELRNWLELKNSFDATDYRLGFLILHSGADGLYILINWWVSENILNNHIFFTNKENQKDFKKISGDGLVACIWELEIMNHERLSWITHVLKPNEPDYKSYLYDTINTKV